MSRAQQWSLTEHLLSLAPDQYKAATQAPFLLAAAQGTLSKAALGKWLANDRLYIHAYIKAAGQLLHAVDLPQHVPETEAAETKLVDWLVDAVAAVRKEERLFIDVAERYGLGIDLVTPVVGRDGLEAAAQSQSRPQVAEDVKVPGLVSLERLFAKVAPQPPAARGSLTASSAASPAAPAVLPWLEGAVIFWGTERCYLDAWSWARSQQSLASAGNSEAREDADGGALRKEFIPNWSSSEFAQFVGQLAAIIDTAVSEVLASLGEGAREDIVARVDTKWKSLLAAEATFWPSVD